MVSTYGSDATLQRQISYPFDTMIERAKVFQDAIDKGKITLEQGNELYLSKLGNNRKLAEYYGIPIPELRAKLD